MIPNNVTAEDVRGYQDRIIEATAGRWPQRKFLAL
jgi:hypothetical protein